MNQIKETIGFTKADDTDFERIEFEFEKPN